MRRLYLEPDQGFPTNTGKNPTDLDETVSLTSKCIVPPCKLVIMHGFTQRTMMTDHRLNVMTQAPYPYDMVALPNGIYIMRAYTDMNGRIISSFFISKINHLLSRPAISVLVILNGYAEEASVVGRCNCSIAMTR